MAGSYGFIDVGRLLEIEALRPARRSNEFSTSPAFEAVVGIDDSNVVFRPADDILESQERQIALDNYLPFARRAFSERGLTYPFLRTGDTLVCTQGARARHLAERIVQLTELSGIGGDKAKEFEVRATKALHRFIGGRGIAVGAPRNAKTGPERAVVGFRKMVKDECGDFRRSGYPPSGDFGADAFFILGRQWGGPVVFVQVKNSSFDPVKFAADLLTGSTAFEEWFGRKLDKSRQVVAVVAVNSTLTIEAKETAFESCLGGFGYHILDCVDIVCAESLWGRMRSRRDQLTLM
jgi:hypothetical protein